VKYRKKAIDSQIISRLNEIFSETLKKWDCSLTNRRKILVLQGFWI
jgi:REP element-mobilizing transposase RayT